MRIQAFRDVEAATKAIAAFVTDIHDQSEEGSSFDLGVMRRHYPELAKGFGTLVESADRYEFDPTITNAEDALGDAREVLRLIQFDAGGQYGPDAIKATRPVLFGRFEALKAAIAKVEAYEVGASHREAVAA